MFYLISFKFSLRIGLDKAELKPESSCSIVFVTDEFTVKVSMNNQIRDLHYLLFLS